ncbi:MAG: Zn-ribbon domain-containing OB-fold protein [Myxococcales bacterium]|nr:Zn-ribbon domain-containing OB-fold protein [Myxococcales bacterium]
MKPVTSIETPTRLEYEFTASGAQAEFLENIARGRLVGKRCPRCEKVYVPARGNCPRCGIATSDSVDVSDHGTVTTFCIVRVPSQNIELDPPYCAANVLLDGSDMPFITLLGECEVEDVRIGMRVEAVWKPKQEWGPTFENIRHFRPSGEPDVPVEKLGAWV